MAEFEHPEVARTKVHSVQDVVFQIPISNKPKITIEDVAAKTRSEPNEVKAILKTMDCADIKKEDGTEEVIKKFDATELPLEQGNIPDACLACPFSNAQQRTGLNSRPTVGCVILGIRKTYIRRYHKR